jgi:type IV pilus assembly protein PilB
MILAERPLPEIRYRAVTGGMTTLRQPRHTQGAEGSTTSREINE